jgi:hypothetical protein
MYTQFLLQFLKGIDHSQDLKVDRDNIEMDEGVDGSERAYDGLLFCVSVNVALNLSDAKKQVPS